MYQSYKPNRNAHDIRVVFLSPEPASST